MPSAWIVTKASPQLVEAFQTAGWEVEPFAPSDLVPLSQRVREPDVMIFEALDRPLLDALLELFRVRFASMLIIVANWAFARQALDAGVDEVMVTPVDPIELLFRAETLARASKVVRVGELAIDLTARRVKLGGRLIKLTPAEFRLLACLAQKIGQAVIYDEILDDVWGADPESGGTSHLVTNCVSRLRRKIEADPHNPQYIISIKKEGYRLRSQAQWGDAIRSS